MKIELRIPSAEEARKTFNDGVYDKALKQAKEIEALIKDAISNGRCSVNGSGILESSVKGLWQQRVTNANPAANTTKAFGRFLGNSSANQRTCKCK